jgi:hypothetical protein
MVASFALAFVYPAFASDLPDLSLNPVPLMKME